jgi:hypothetical protein
VRGSFVRIGVMFIAYNQEFLQRVSASYTYRFLFACRKERAVVQL